VNCLAVLFDCVDSVCACVFFSCLSIEGAGVLVSRYMLGSIFCMLNERGALCFLLCELCA
jgi:hypothetical protein